MELVDIKNDSSIPAVLIIIYRRFKNLAAITEVIAAARIPRLYLAVDVPPANLQTEEYRLERDGTLRLLRNMCKVKNIELFIWIRRENLGCARSVLSACQWFYKNEEYGAVLEDDCIPTLDFFEFAKQNRKVLENHKKVYFICGTQHANVKDLSKSIPYLITSYPFLWGWATSRDKWTQIIEVFLQNTAYKTSSSKSKRENFYWRTGIRRALQRRVDVWDTIIVGFMSLNSFFAILPLRNLIDNQGLDEFATNHIGGHAQKAWDIVVRTDNVWKELEFVDASIRRHLLKITWLMPARNLSRLVLDLLKPSKQIPLPKKLVKDFQDIPLADTKS
jgi:hypothetical protein